MCPNLHSFLRSCSESARSGFLADGDPTRPGDQSVGYQREIPKGEKSRSDDRLKHISPSYDDEEDDE